MLTTRLLKPLLHGTSGLIQVLQILPRHLTASGCLLQGVVATPAVSVGVYGLRSAQCVQLWNSSIILELNVLLVAEIHETYV
jgi:hypothetical protein